MASPQILQLSGVGDPDVLSRAGVKLVHKLPSVGRNLHNHVAHFLNFQVNDNNTTPLNWATAMEYLLFRDGLMSGTGESKLCHQRSMRSYSWSYDGSEKGLNSKI